MPMRKPCPPDLPPCLPPCLLRNCLPPQMIRSQGQQREGENSINQPPSSTLAEETLQRKQPLTFLLKLLPKPEHQFHHERNPLLICSTLNKSENLAVINFEAVWVDPPGKEHHWGLRNSRAILAIRQLAFLANEYNKLESPPSSNTVQYSSAVQYKQALSTSTVQDSVHSKTTCGGSISCMS